MAALKHRAASLLILALLALIPCPSFAKEVIRSFESAIIIHQDGRLTVRERISARSEGVEINHGLFRDFPLTFRKDDGSLGRVDFSLTDAAIDGQPAAWHSETISGGIRIYLGDAQTVLTPGRHDFELTYQVNREIRYFQDHDELYWNVTGNGWAFPIDHVSARVTPPGGIQPTGVSAYTGPLGAKGQDYTVTRQSGTVLIETTRPLGLHEGLTIALSFPKGAIAEPDATEKTLWALRDRAALVIGFGGLALVLAYYLWAWVRVGRDPPPGLMVPRWTPPDDLSPALVNYVENKGFRGQAWAALSASLIDLGVKGYVTLDNRNPKRMVLTRTDKTTGLADLPTGQRAILEQLGRAGETFTLEKANGTGVVALHARFTKAIEGEHRGRYYKANSGFVALGIILSVVVLVSLALFGNLSPDIIPFVIPVGVVTIIAVILTHHLRNLFITRETLAKRIITLAGFGGLLFFLVQGLLMGAMHGLMEDLSLTDMMAIIALAAIILVNGLFLVLMGAPTPLGVKKTAEVEGLRTYLELAEKDRMNMADLPELTPRHFETLLPYAVALGVEKPWSKAFRDHMASARVEQDYHPLWVLGGTSHGFDAGDLSSSMSQSFTSSLPDPPRGSSSGMGGGGSSGGGGGGGGGGGW
ncbi:DUF2207 domain-containing protein [Rhodospirillum sp. A1_3_36]|uniref:DUF2207 domain-containing protein n=1 Tax=Rhodospirillum sp. A1_3_36 TaxID=3391666 RepID=UPI0039A41AE0